MEYNSTTDEDFRHMLRTRVQHRADHLQHLQAQQQKLMAEIECARQYVDHGNQLLLDEGLPPVTAVETVTATIPNEIQSQTAIGAFTTGNRSSRMPNRRADFASISLVNAVRQLLDQGQTMHLEELASAIYDTQNPTDLKAAKGNLRSVLATGVKRGFWERGEQSATVRIPRQEVREMMT